VSSGDLHPERVPDAEHAEAADEKFTDYLLNESHPVGAGKAKFFKRLGFDASNWGELRDTFLVRLPSCAATLRKENAAGGENWEAVIPVQTSAGFAFVRTFWEVHPRTGTRFLTAYPLALKDRT
jgi:hypothetical protein